MMNTIEFCTLCNCDVGQHGMLRHCRKMSHIKAMFAKSDDDSCESMLRGKFITITSNKLLYDLIFPSFKTAARFWAGNCCKSNECKYHHHHKPVMNELLESLSCNLRDKVLEQYEITTGRRQQSPLPALPGLFPVEKVLHKGNFLARVNCKKILHTTDTTSTLPTSSSSLPEPMSDECEGDVRIQNHIQAIHEYFELFYPYIKYRMADMVRVEHSYKLNVILHLKLIKLKERQLVKVQSREPYIVCDETNLDELITRIRDELITIFDTLEYIKHSGWTLRSINGLELQVSIYNTLSTASRTIRGAHNHYCIPKFLLSKKALINVQGGPVDGMCFKEALGVKLLYMRGVKKNLHLASHYHSLERVGNNCGRKANFLAKDLYAGLDFSMVSFPTKLTDIKAFERANKVCVNVFGFDSQKKIIYPLQVGKFENLPQSLQNELIQNNGESLSVQGIWDILYLNPKHKSNQQLDSDTDSTHETDDEPKEFGHFVFIKDLARLLHNQLGEKNLRKVICRNCMKFYTYNGYRLHLEKCESIGGGDGKKATKCIMPSIEDGNDQLDFSQSRKKHEIELPYVIYSDFESALIEKLPRNGSMNLGNENTDTNDEDGEEPLIDSLINSASNVENVHEPTSYCYLIVSRNPSDTQTYHPKLYRGENAVKKFWTTIEKEVSKIGKICSETNIPMNLSNDEVRLRCRQATECYLCHEKFTDKCVRVMDHDHLTGRARGVAHNSCNLLYRRAHYVPVIFHNGSKYDFKLIIKDIISIQSEMPRVTYPSTSQSRENSINEVDIPVDVSVEDDDDNDLPCKSETVRKNKRKYRKKRTNISVIASSTETMISFEKSWGFYPSITTTTAEGSACEAVSQPGNYRGGRMSIRFIDSMRFLNSSLANLANILPADLKKQTRAIYPDDYHFNMACRKGVFPYEHIKSHDSYKEEKLPPIECFSSKLNGGKGISVEDYKFACEFYIAFGCKNLGDYSDIYLQIDVLLLADIFENFRDLCLRIYKLDPLWYYSAPGLSWNAMLKSGISKGVQLITEYDQYLFAESAVRGGLCVVSKRHVEANNPRMGHLYDQTQPTNYLTYFDANNLYGYSMSMPLPSGDYRWLDEGFDTTTWTVQQENSRMSNIRQMIDEWSEDSDTGYMLEVDLHYPTYLHNLHNDFPLCPEKLCTPQSRNIPKLINTLFDKKKYVTHVAYLKRVLALGLELKRVYRVLCFSQRAWLAEYINLNTEHRKHATSQFDIDFFKLMNNVIFGKCLENVRGRRDIRLVYKDATIKNLVADPRFKQRLILNADTNLCLIEIGKKSITFDKPVCIGATILELAKCVMTDFHYNTMKHIFPKAELCYHDTDSFIYDIPCDNPCEDIYTGALLRNSEKHFDFSSLPPTHPLYSRINYKVPGKFSDELCGAIGLGFIGLRPKVYTIKILEERSNEDKEEENAAGSSSICCERIVKKAKGVNKNVVAMAINYNLYKKVLEDGRYDNDDNNDKSTSKGLYVEQYNIQSRRMEIQTVKMRKLALSWNDDKRFICPDGVHTFAWGHNSTLNTTTNNNKSCYTHIPHTKRAILLYTENAPLLQFPSNKTDIAVSSSLSLSEQWCSGNGSSCGPKRVRDHGDINDKGMRKKVRKEE